jgi:hypothetical protein
LAELFFDLGRLSDVYACIEEACRTFPNSHQALYLKVSEMNVVIVVSMNRVDCWPVVLTK